MTQEPKKRIGLVWGLISWLIGAALWTALYYALFAVANWSFSPANWGSFSRWTFAILTVADAGWRLNLASKRIKETNL